MSIERRPCQLGEEPLPLNGSESATHSTPSEAIDLAPLDRTDTHRPTTIAVHLVEQPLTTADQIVDISAEHLAGSESNASALMTNQAAEILDMQALERRQQRLAYWRAYAHAYRQRPEKKERRREVTRESVRRWRERNPELARERNRESMRKSRTEKRRQVDTEASTNTPGQIDTENS
jgi:hypothetical protein